jgi:hypothetical protein
MRVNINKVARKLANKYRVTVNLNISALTKISFRAKINPDKKLKEVNLHDFW